MKEEIKKAIAQRDSRMFGYYESVFKEDYELGYPKEWDDEFNSVIESLVSKAKQETWDKAIADVEDSLKALSGSPNIDIFSSKCMVVAALKYAKEKDI